MCNRPALLSETTKNHDELRDFSFDLIKLSTEKQDEQEVPAPLTISSESSHDTVESSVTEASTEGRHVKWEKISVRNYPIILGDHPEPLMGPALTIDWEPCSELEFPVDDYEEIKLFQPRRQGNDLRMDWLKRKQLLRGMGFCDADMYVCKRKAERVRQQRQQTINGLRFEVVSLAKESILHKLGKTTVLETKY
jgi:hypothetical protein